MAPLCDIYISIVDYVVYKLLITKKQEKLDNQNNILMLIRMKVEKLKRNFWTTGEIDCMLNLLRDVYRTQGCTQTTNYTFIQLANRMRKKGFPNKSAEQIRRKWFQMKSAYLCYKRGNTERLLLIPERFRLIIAQFVDREIKMPNYQEFSPPQQSEPTPPPPLSPPQPTAPSPVQTPPVQPAHYTGHTQYNNRKNTTSNQQPTLENNGVKMDYVDKRFDDFLSRVRQTHKIISNDFMNMQKILMDFEHACQKERDAKLVSFIRNINYDF